MLDEIDTNENTMNTFTVRFDSKLVSMIDYLKSKKCLTKTALIRLAIAELYNREKCHEFNGGR